jgi:hypothetical protein
MRTLITHDVKYKWLKLDKRVVELLLELEYNKYNALPDGTLIVEMDESSYGHVEAAHYWYEKLPDLHIK